MYDRICALTPKRENANDISFNVHTYVKYGSMHNRALPAAIENYLASPGILYSRRVAASLNRCIPLRGTPKRATRIIYSSSPNRGRDASALRNHHESIGKNDSDRETFSLRKGLKLKDIAMNEIIEIS